MALTGSSIATTYLKLLRANSDTMGADATASYIQDSADTDSALSISTTRVGIGTAAPTHLLSLYGGTLNATGGMNFKTDDTGSASTDGTTLFVEQGSKSFYIRNYEAGNVYIRTTDLTRMSILAGGEVGIGVDAPSTLVEIQGGLTTTGAVLTLSTKEPSVVANDVLGRINFQAPLDTGADSDLVGASIHALATATFSDTVNETDLVFSTGASETATEAMRITSDGYIVNEQGRQNHVANTMSSPYYRFDGANDEIAIADTAHLNFGNGTTDNAFSISAWINMEDATSFPIITKGVYNSDAEWQFITESDDKLYFNLFDESVASCLIGRKSVATLTSYEGKWIHVAGTYSGSSADTGLKLYINGVQVADATNTGGSYVAMEDVSGESRIGQIGDSTYGQGSISELQIFNLELSATEVKELYSGASVPFKYKGASQTDLIEANDAGSGTAWTGATGTTPPDGWTSGGSGRTFTIDSGTLKITAGTGNAWIRQNWNTVKGKRYRAQFIYKNTAGDVVQYATDAGVGVITDLADSTGWSAVQTVEFTGTGSVDFMLFAKNTGDIVWVDNVSVYQIGAVAEYDGSGIASDKWFDKSGNDLHGAVDGASVENAPTGDDGLVYEEGTHTVTPSYSTSGSVALDSGYQTLSYARIGNMVHLQGNLRITSTGSQSGYLQFSLPYTSHAGGTDYEYRTSSVFLTSGVDFDGTAVGARIEESATNMLLFAVRDNNSFGNITVAVSDDYFINISYLV
jgi:hypothetical protein